MDTPKSLFEAAVLRMWKTIRHEIHPLSDQIKLFVPVRSIHHSEFAVIQFFKKSVNLSFEKKEEQQDLTMMTEEKWVYATSILMSRYNERCQEYIDWAQRDFELTEILYNE